MAWSNQGPQTPSGTIPPIRPVDTFYQVWIGYRDGQAALDSRNWLWGYPSRNARQTVYRDHENKKYYLNRDTVLCAQKWDHYKPLVKRRDFSNALLEYLIHSLPTEPARTFSKEPEGLKATPSNTEYFYAPTASIANPASGPVPPANSQSPFVETSKEVDALRNALKEYNSLRFHPSNGEILFDQAKQKLLPVLQKFQNVSVFRNLDVETIFNALIDQIDRNSTDPIEEQRPFQTFVGGDTKRKELMDAVKGDRGTKRKNEAIAEEELPRKKIAASRLESLLEMILLLRWSSFNCYEILFLAGKDLLSCRSHWKSSQTGGVSERV